MSSNRILSWHSGVALLCFLPWQLMAGDTHLFHFHSDPQTPLAQLVDQTSGMTQRLLVLGPPHYVVRKGRFTGIAAYDETLDLKESIAAAFWSNGACLPAMALFQLDQKASLEVATVEAGGIVCMKDGTPYPTPSTDFACAHGAATDPLCNLNWVLTNVTIAE